MPEPRRRRHTTDGGERRSRSEPPRAQATSRDHGDAQGDEAQGRDRGSTSRPRPAIGQLARSARQQLEDLIGRPVHATLGFERQEEGWQMTVEVVELERIPNTTSILGCYRALVNDDGDLLEYRRVRRYSRSQPDEDI
jgi:Gas vesicle synthesis protein GvpO